MQIAWWSLSAHDRYIKKIGRIYNRFLTGTSNPGEYRMITLTTPPSFDGDLHQAWRKFVKRMHRRNLFRGYFAVKEFNKAGDLVHIHCAVRLSYIDYRIALEHWYAVTGSRWVHIDKVWDKGGMCRYVLKYITKELTYKKWKHCYWYSQDWIHYSYVKFGKALLHYGSFPHIEETKFIATIQGKVNQKAYMLRRLITEFMYADPKPETCWII